MWKRRTFQREKVWEFPVRAYHWINAACILVLIATGFLIGRPVALQLSREASFSYWFGIVRFIHFVAAYIFFFNMLYRVYWAIVGNKYARWHNYLPYRKEQFKEVVEVLKIDIFHPGRQPLPSVGHNALANFTYFLTFLAFLFQTATGFAMYAAMSDAWLPSLFAWVVPLMGGDFAVRQWHHLAMWFFIIFTFVHVYLVFYHDYVEGRGVLSSMAGGWKFVEKGDAEQAQKEEEQEGEPPKPA
ncbi:MAG: Ni/Fe-hydrogenase, b-type cytochrome subunit [Planctomycetota bacterium]|jgi:Ni/Fe-hydrogenase 1 B-type cytochrome subunit